jgi:hypothetical protein
MADQERKDERGDSTETTEKYIAAWQAEIRRLAALVSAASPGACAFVKISATGDEYVDIAAELLPEDVLRVSDFGWQHGYTFEVLNPTP